MRRPKTWRNLAWTIAQMGLSAPPNQLKAKCWGEMDGWGIEARSFAVQHRRRFGCRNTSYGTDPKRQNPSKIHAQGAPNGFEDRGPFSTFEPAKSKELERDGWMGYRSFAVQHRRRCGCRNTSEGTVPHPSKIHAQAVPHGFEDRGPFSTFKPANSKELERDGWMGYRSFAVQHRRRFGCRNTSEGTVAKRQNPSKIRTQAQQKQYVRRVQNSTFGAP